MNAEEINTQLALGTLPIEEACLLLNKCSLSRDMLNRLSTYTDLLIRALVRRHPNTTKAIKKSMPKENLRDFIIVVRGRSGDVEIQYTPVVGMINIITIPCPNTTRRNALHSLYFDWKYIENCDALWE